MANMTATNTAAGSTTHPLPFAGTPGAGTSAVDTLTIGGTPTAQAGSGFTLAFEGYTTALILWSATNATLVGNIDTALELLANTGSGTFTTAVGTMTAGVGTITITYASTLATKAAGPVTVGTNSMAGTAPTVAVSNTTPGVSADFRGQAKGTLVVDTTNGLLYINTGTGYSPTWTKVGTQT
jgi:hypothetical protein